jgi:hypothetical protein
MLAFCPRVIGEPVTMLLESVRVIVALAIAHHRTWPQKRNRVCPDSGECCDIGHQVVEHIPPVPGEKKFDRRVYEPVASGLKAFVRAALGPARHEIVHHLGRPIDHRLPSKNCFEADLRLQSKKA